MTHFDFKTLLPALLQVEDRVSMAHGIESRVPLLDHPLVEFAATIPSDIKFKDGAMKHCIRRVRCPSCSPTRSRSGRTRWAFPTPLHRMDPRRGARVRSDDLLSSTTALDRELIDNRKVLEGYGREPKFGRKIWGLLCLELWQQEFHDREARVQESDQRARGKT